MHLERLFDKYRELTVLKFFLDNPGREIHVKGLAREIGVGPRTATEALNSYAKDGILNKKIVANVHLFRLNNDSETAKKLLELRKVMGK